MEDKHIGVQYNDWTVLSRVPPNRPSKYMCRCKCGEEKVVWLANLRASKSTKCSKCAWTDKNLALIGYKKNHITLIGYDHSKAPTPFYNKCDCGNTRWMKASPKNPRYKTCGRCTLNGGKYFYKKIEEGFEISTHHEGERFGNILLIKNLGKSKYKAQCDCGNMMIARLGSLRKGRIDCGCKRTERLIENAQRLVGIKYGYLKVKKFKGFEYKKNAKRPERRAYYLLKCKCGKEIERDVGHMFGAKSCGCGCREALPRGENQAHASLTDREAGGVKELIATGLYTQREIARMLNVHETVISNIATGKTWKHLKK